MESKEFFFFRGSICLKMTLKTATTESIFFNFWDSTTIWHQYGYEYVSKLSKPHQEVYIYIFRNAFQHPTKIHQVYSQNGFGGGFLIFEIQPISV